MVSLRVKVVSKGQIVIPKILREAYRIREGGYAILEPGENEIRIRSVLPPEEIIKWIRERRAQVGGKEARLGDLARVDLEEEFED